MSRFLVLSLCVLLVAVFAEEKAEEENKPHAVEYDEEKMKEVSKSPHFVKFYAPWCGHCKKLAPKWEELAKKYNTEGEQKEATIAKVDCTVHSAVCSEHGVKGYPTLLMFKDNEPKGTKYQGQRDIESLDKFVQEKLIGKEPEKKEEAAEGAAAAGGEAEKAVPTDGLYELSSANFEAHVAHGKHFIKFYAPWCGHCKRLAPTWVDLAKAFENDKDVTIAKLDCTANSDPCTKNEVRGYPTLLFMSEGKVVKKYSGARDLEALKMFTEEMKVAKEDAQAGSEQEKIPDKKPERKEKKVEAEPEGDADTAIVHLTDDTFEETIAKGTTFVKFFAPWCGHCKRLAPTWEDLAKKYKENANINIAKVDCTVHKDTCKKHSVRGYPTLLLFRNGEKVGDHNGGRDLDSLSNFVMESVPHDEL